MDHGQWCSPVKEWHELQYLRTLRLACGFPVEVEVEVEVEVRKGGFRYDNRSLGSICCLACHGGGDGDDDDDLGMIEPRTSSSISPMG